MEKPTKLESKLIDQSLALIKEKGAQFPGNGTIGDITLNNASMHLEGLFADYGSIEANYKKLSRATVYICYETNALSVNKEVTPENPKGSYKIRRSGSMIYLAALVQELFNKYIGKNKKETKKMPVV